MQPPGLGTNLLGDSSGEGNYIVLYLSLNLPDSFDLECAPLADRLRRRPWHDSRFGQGVGCSQLNCQPHAKFVFVTPDPVHFGPGIACDHSVLLTGGSSTD